jgi:serine/threonine protein kinase
MSASLFRVAGLERPQTARARVPTSISDEPDDSAPDPAEVAARRVGEVFAGKWKIERVLGAGGMATVYAATHTNNQRVVALKVLHPELTASGEMKKRFLREGFIANRIGHPGAVAILDDGVDDDGNVFLVMELLTGASVADRIRAERGNRADRVGAPPPRAFDQAEALRIADGVLDVLIAAHAQGILHRDLKPDNVFVTDEGEVKVLDFGIARLREPQSGPSSEGEAKTRTGVVLGTPQYMPPEQARGRSSLVDERSDLWSVGAIVFAMLTGRHVHEAETPNEALLKAMTATATPIGTVLSGVNPRVAAIVDRALAFEQNERYPDARAMQTEVRETIPRLTGRTTELSPGSGAAGGVVGRAVTADSRSPRPIVRDTSVGRSGGFRIVSIVVVIGAAAVAGRALLNFIGARPSGAQGPIVSTADAGIHPTSAAHVPAAPARPDAAAALAVEPPDAALVFDAGPDAEIGDAGDAGDAEADEEDDDGGDEDDDVAFESPPPLPGHPGHAAVPAHRGGGAPVHRAGEPRKKGKRRKKRH